MSIPIAQNLRCKQKESINKAKLKTELKPKPFTHLSYVFVIVFVVLLISQLGAIELPRALRNDSQSSTISTLKPASSDKHGGGKQNGSHQSEPHPDVVSSKSNNFSMVASSDMKTVKLSNSSISQQQHHNLDFKSREPTQTFMAASEVKPIVDAVNLHSGFDLVSAPTAIQTQIQSPQDKPGQDQQLVYNNYVGPSLDDIAAVGTRAGLLAHDLMMRAAVERNQLNTESNLNSVAQPSPVANEITAANENLLYQQLPHGNDNLVQAPSETGESREVDDNDDEPSQRKAYEDYRQQNQPVVNDVESVNDDSSGQQLSSGEQPPMNGQLANAMLKQQSYAYRANSQPTNIGDEAPNGLAADAGPEPPGEEQMPDSMDSLMRSEGENVDTNDDDEPAQQAGSNLVNQGEPSADNQGIPVEYQQTSQLQPLTSKSTSDSDADFDDDDVDVDSSDFDPARAIPAATRNIVGTHNLNSIYTKNNQIPLGALNHDRLNSGQVDHANSLVAPMRDSLSDLNTAAGHYYGKKKKKKKVKIVIKKKKHKKKKKYVKKKKVKVIKIVKKKKKKPKKKMKKHHHGHDHGKYYM